MKYWTYMNEEVPGSFEPQALAALPGFSMTTLVCPGEGEIAEKNWRRAGEFEDIARAVEARAAKAAPAPPLGAPPAGNEVDALLDTASTRLFSHVADLMKELETRRDEKSLIVSLQRQISALKAEAASARETATMLEIRIPRLVELEDAQLKHQSALAQLQEHVAARDLQLNELRIFAEKTRGELDAAKRRGQEHETDLAIRNRLVDKLSHDLSEKELSLAKALGVIRRLEEDLNRLCPPPDRQSPAAASAADPVAAQAPAAAPPAAAPSPAAAPPDSPPPAPRVVSIPVSASDSFTDDEPPPAPPYLEPHRQDEPPKAQQALTSFFRKVFPGQSQ